MATTKTAFDYINDMFTAMGSQDALRAQAANSALSTGLDFYQKKDYTRAASEFKRSIAMDPTNTQTYNFLANSYLAQNKPEEAIKAYKNSLAMDPYQDSVHVNLGNIYLQQKKYNMAEKEFKEASKINPSSTLAPYTLGQLYVQTDRLDEAAAQFKKVQKMAKSDPNPYYSLGMVYNKQGNYKEAVKQLTEAVRLRPKMAAAHLELGVAYAALGETDKANAEVQTLTRLDSAQGALLKASIARPKMVTAGGGDTDTFKLALGMNTQVFALDVELLEPNKAKEVSLSFYFDSKMDANSVMDPSNWTISKATGGVAGYYNNLLSIRPTEAYIPQNPTRVTYDSEKQVATVSFLLSQNADGNATIDPSHMVFKFSGTDARGKVMDPTADEFDGFAQTPF